MLVEYVKEMRRCLEEIEELQSVIEWVVLPWSVDTENEDV